MIVGPLMLGEKKGAAGRGLHWVAAAPAAVAGGAADTVAAHRCTGGLSRSGMPTTA